MNLAGSQIPTLVVVPTFNEAAVIQEFLTRSLAADPNLNILVVDDGSPDGTGDLVESFVQSTNRIKLLRRASKLGLGTAYIAGFQKGLAEGFELFIEMDADLSHDPADLPRLIAAMSDADLTIGSRYVKGGAVEGWSRRRHLLSAVGNLYARAVLRFPVKDSTSGFRCFRREVLLGLDLESIHSEGYAFQIEMAHRAFRRGFRVREIPITFRERATGVSKMSKQIIVEGLVSVTRWGRDEYFGRREHGASVEKERTR